MADYSEILARHYPNNQWVVKGNPQQYASIVSFVPENEKPSQATLDALWPAVAAQIQSELETRAKHMTFESVYPIQTQQLIIARAQSTGDNTELNTMLNFWDSL